MKVGIVGAHGRAGLALSKLVAQGGHDVAGLVRNAAHQAALEEVGVKAIVGTLQTALLQAFLSSLDAVVFTAAGSLGHYQEVDHEGVAATAAAAETAGVKRFVLLSAVGAHDPSSWGPVYRPFLQAKAEGEAGLKTHQLEWTIVRPGSLHDNSPTGLVMLTDQPGGSGSISRQDVAQVLAAILAAPGTGGRVSEVYERTTPIAKAVRAFTAPTRCIAN